MRCPGARTAEMAGLRVAGYCPHTSEQPRVGARTPAWPRRRRSTCSWHSSAPRWQRAGPGPASGWPRPSPGSSSSPSSGFALPPRGSSAPHLRGGVSERVLFSRVWVLAMVAGAPGPRRGDAAQNRYRRSDVARETEESGVYEPATSPGETAKRRGGTIECQEGPRRGERSATWEIQRVAQRGHWKSKNAARDRDSESVTHSRERTCPPHSLSLAMFPQHRAVSPVAPSRLHRCVPMGIRLATLRAGGAPVIPREPPPPAGAGPAPVLLRGRQSRGAREGRRSRCTSGGRGQGRPLSVAPATFRAPRAPVPGQKRPREHESAPTLGPSHCTGGGLGRFDVLECGAVARNTLRSPSSAKGFAPSLTVGSMRESLEQDVPLDELRALVESCLGERAIVLRRPPGRTRAHAREGPARGT